ncbi:alpha/beta fold hydrolase [Aspergillus ibericus CBS 121593]|uniref:Alpha/beta-hydrolase n=1 Tax=Aspergillus ibericus CBS 121593 TaxID=1448316 RepID=A0A395H8C3_9EURO|nr:alpha/beta-hydrolase [Aspergillus ibericus CBS 121593]RAL03128.1 alpha/beta-hydrolase [Aspergillus ibericus CBS 121593]
MESHTLPITPQTTIHFTITQTPTPNTNPLLIFLHYWGGSSTTWYKQTSPTSPHTLTKTHNTVTIDLRGWGQSTGPTTDPSPKDYSITPMASDIVSVINHLHTTTPLLTNGITLIGHSMGAKLCLAVLSTLPPPLLSLIKGLILLAPAPPSPLILPEEMSNQQRSAYTSEDSIRWTVTNVLSNTASLSANDMDMIVKDSSSGNALARDGWILYGMAEDITALVDGVVGRLEGREVRVYVVAGEEDAVESRERVKREVVGFLRAREGFRVEFEVLGGVRHLVPLEEPGVVRRAVEWVG